MGLMQPTKHTDVHSILCICIAALEFDYMNLELMHYKLRRIGH